MARQGPKADLTVQQDAFVRMEANGLSSEEIIEKLFGLHPEDHGYHSMECKLSRWRKHPKYTETWMDEVRNSSDFKDYSKARRTLRKSMDDPEKWLAMNAAINVLNDSGKRIFGTDGSTVTVKIEGGSFDLGTPNPEDG